MKYFPPLVLFSAFLAVVGVYVSLFVFSGGRPVVGGIIYIHFSLYLALVLSIAFCVLLSLVYLLKRRGWADSFAWSFSKAAAVLGVLAFLTGSIWNGLEGTRLHNRHLGMLIVVFVGHLIYIVSGISESVRYRTRKLRATVYLLGALVLILATLYLEASALYQTEIIGELVSRSDGRKVLAYDIVSTLICFFSIAIYDGVRDYSKILLRVPPRGRLSGKEP